MKQTLTKYLPREPRTVSPNDWFYLERKGFILVHRVFRSAGYVQSDQIFISWEKIRKALRDYDLAVLRQDAEPRGKHKPRKTK